MAAESGSSSDKSLEMRIAAIEDKLSRLGSPQGGGGASIPASAIPMIPQICTTCYHCYHCVIVIAVHQAASAQSAPGTQGGSQGFGNLGK